MVPPLPPKQPLDQMGNSFHGETHQWPSAWKAAFQEVRDLLREQLPGVSLSQFDCLDRGEWLHDDILHLFVDCLKRGIPEPQSDAALGVSPPSQIRDGGNPLLLDLNEVCILDPQHGKIIQLAFETSDYTACLKMLKQNVRFHTAKRILLPLNTSGKRIAMESGSHWMLAELDLTSDEVAITNAVMAWLRVTVHVPAESSLCVKLPNSTAATVAFGRCMLCTGDA